MYELACFFYKIAASTPAPMDFAPFSTSSIMNQLVVVKAGLERAQNRLRSQKLAQY